MRLKKYCKIHGRGTMTLIAEDAEVSYLTVRNAARGMRIKLYDVARRISQATDWQVSIPELCEDRPPKWVKEQFTNRKS